MSLTTTLRRSAVGLAAATLLVGGSVGFAAAATTAGADTGVSDPQVVTSILLHNDTAETTTDCPTGGAAYWHFVFAPNNGTYTFTLISLDLGTEVMTFSGAAIVPNGTQKDNVFVAVPAGHELTDLVTGSKSFAEYTGGTEAPTQFNLSHVCQGTVPTTETPTTETPATETPATVTPSTDVSVLGTVQTSPAAGAEVTGAVPVTSELPYTGTDTTGMVVAGLAVLLGGALLAGLARTKGRNLGEQ